MIDFESFRGKYQNVPVEEYPNRVLEAMPQPVVSVQVSTYQHADFIRDCLDGILMQETNFPFEILIGEDESSDGTREICKAYADRHPDKIRLFLHRRENNIAIHGRPTGRFQSTYTRFMCRGKYIAICEGDDYWTDPLKLQVDFLEEHPNHVCVYQHSINKVVGKSKTPNIQSNNIPDKIITWPKTLTIVHKNIVYDYPEAFFNIPNGDTFLLLKLGNLGKIGCVQTLRPAIRRLHPGGMWSMIDPAKRSREGFHSCTLMFDHFRGTASEPKAKEELTKALRRLVEVSPSFGDFKAVIRILVKSYLTMASRGLGYEAAIIMIKQTLRGIIYNKTML